MYKKYCDICGQEIPEAPDLRPRQGRFELADHAIPGPRLVRLDLCIDCAKETEGFLGELKKKGGKVAILVS